MVLSKMEYILLIQNCTSKIANCSSFNNKWRHHDFTATLKMVANFMILSLLLIFQYFSVYGYFYEKID